MNLPDCETLTLSLDAEVLHVPLNRPASRKAMTAAMVDEPDRVFDAVAAGDCAIRVRVLHGAGGHFCAGAVIGRGFGLSCVSDVAPAHVNASFGLPETTRGLPPAQIVPFGVVARIGLIQARRLCPTDTRFDGAEALRRGPVPQTCADEMQWSQPLDVLLGQIPACAPRANAVTQAIVLNVGHQTMDEVLDDGRKGLRPASAAAKCRRGSARSCRSARRAGRVRTDSNGKHRAIDRR